MFERQLKIVAKPKTIIIMSGPYIPQVLEATSAVVVYYNPLYVEPQKVKNIGVDQLFISGQELIDRVISLVKTTPGR